MQTKQAALTEALFVAKIAYRELDNTGPQPENNLPPAILFNDLMRLASGALGLNDNQRIDMLMTGINDNIVLGRQYRDLVKGFSFVTSAALAAASTQEEMPSRQTDNMSLKFKRDSIDTSQVFALLSIKHPNDRHNVEAVVMNIFTATHCERITFPPLIDGASQHLFDENDPKLKFLLDLDAQISIMP